MPIATKLDMKKDLKPPYTPPTSPVFVEVPQLRYLVTPLEGLIWPTERTATLLAARYQGVGHRLWSASGSLSAGFPRRSAATGMVRGGRKALQVLGPLALHLTDGIAGWTGED